RPTASERFVPTPRCSCSRRSSCSAPSERAERRIARYVIARERRPPLYCRPMRSQQWRLPAGPGAKVSLALGLVATCAVAALSLSMSGSTARAEAPPSPAAGPADLILLHGRIYTLDAQKPWAQALAIREDRILAVGGDREIRALAGPRTKVIDLHGKFALPGFNDAHVHIEATGALLVGTNLLDVHEPKAFVERVRAAAGRLPRGSWITRGDWGAYEQWSAGSSGNTAQGSAPA